MLRWKIVGGSEALVLYIYIYIYIYYYDTRYDIFVLNCQKGKKIYK